jgi:hypothetical protein
MDQSLKKARVWETLTSLHFTIVLLLRLILVHRLIPVHLVLTRIMTPTVIYLMIRLMLLPSSPVAAKEKKVYSFSAFLFI